MTTANRLRRIRICLSVFIAGLLLSGITAFPLETEMRGFAGFLHDDKVRPLAESIGLLSWIDHVYQGLRITNHNYPFLSYGTDWLAFAHIAFAVLFIGPYLEPVRNQWVITFGLIACVGIIPLALVAGPIRGIPFGWRLVDCSFGVFGAIPLWICRRTISQLHE